MKKNIHPKTHPVVFIDGEHQIISTSTRTTDKTMNINGVDHYVINIEVSSYTHPLYTGEKRFVDTQGQVSKFEEKKEKAIQYRAALKKKNKTQEEKKQQSRRTLKDLLGEM